MRTNSRTDLSVALSKATVLAYLLFATTLSCVAEVIDRAGNIVKNYSAKTNIGDSYRHYEVVKPDGAIGELPYMLELKTKRKIYFPENVTPVIPQCLIFGEPPTDPGLQVVEFKEATVSKDPFHKTHKGVFDAKTGSLVKLPSEFEDMSWFACGRASFSIIDSDSNRKYGFLDENGKVVIEPIYDEVYEFTENLVPVMRAGLWSFLDKYGKTAIGLSPDCHRANCFTDGLASVVIGHDPLTPSGWPGEDNRLGFIDKSGKLVISPQFACKYRGPGFYYGLAAVVQDDPRHLEGYIDKSGSWVIQPQFERAEPFRADGTAQVTFGVRVFDRTAWQSGDRYRAFLALVVSPGLLNLKRTEITELLGKADSINGDEQEYIIFSGHGGTSAFTVHFRDNRIDKFKMNYMKSDEWFDAKHAPRISY